MLPRCVRYIRPVISSRAFSEGSRKGFLTNLIDHVKKEMEKNKQLKDNLNRLKAETERLEQSDALKQARKKFEVIEHETAKSSERLRQHLVQLQQYLGKSLEDAKKTSIGRAGVEIGENVYKTAREAVGTLEKSVEELSKTPTYRNLSESAKAVSSEFDQFAFANGWVYRRIGHLKRRTDDAWSASEHVIMENPDVSTVTVHKDERWYSSFKSWADSNPYFRKFMDMKVQYEESSNPVFLFTKFLSEKVSDAARAVFHTSSVSEAATEICKADPNFDIENFCLHCQQEIIPNVLEAAFQQEMDIVKDWCSEVAFAQLTHLITECSRAGYVVRSRLLDVGKVEVVMGKMTEFGPVLLLAFRTHQVRLVSNTQGQPMFGTTDAPIAVAYVWAFCRDLEELNPNAAWKIMEVVEHSSKPVV